jgi:hypothetical protein
MWLRGKSALRTYVDHAQVPKEHWTTALHSATRLDHLWSHHCPHIQATGSFKATRPSFILALAVAFGQTKTPHHPPA